MSTKKEILHIADSLIREKGYNAFSFSDISKQLNIKNASVHYHFPTKTALGVSIINDYHNKLEEFKQEQTGKTSLQKLNAFLSIYSSIKEENKICIVGSLVTDLYTIEPEMQEGLKKFANNFLSTVADILEEGKIKGVFYYNIPSRTKALMIITNMLAAVQLTRLTNNEDFQQIKQTIINDLTIKR